MGMETMWYFPDPMATENLWRSNPRAPATGAAMGGCNAQLDHMT